MPTQQNSPKAQSTVADAMISTPKVSDTTTTVRDVRAMLADDHVHAALIVDDDGILITVIEREDLRPHPGDDSPAMTLGTLHGRIVSANTPLAQTRRHMLASGRRRLAVVDTVGRLQGLLCLKRTRTGFCSDEDVRARSTETAATAPHHPRHECPLLDAAVPQRPPGTCRGPSHDRQLRVYLVNGTSLCHVKPWRSEREPTC